MSERQVSVVGKVVEIWRYPVKSMMGEELNATEVSERGLLGDRAYALIDTDTGKVASAKNPRLWPNLFDCRASYVEPPRDARSLPPVRITLPNGECLTTDQADVEPKLSASVGRTVRIAQSSDEEVTSEGYWPDHDWLAQRDEVFEFPLPKGTFFDGAPVHIITTATLDHLRSLSPANRFEVRRFRPNLVVESTAGSPGFVENEWNGQTLVCGEVALRIDGPCPRCIMTTLSQGSLPKDPGILRTAVQNNDGNVGVYATVVGNGRVCRGDTVELSGPSE
jgi:uncharacterized protein YcbX